VEEVPEEEVTANAASAYLLFYARHDLLQASALDFQRDVYPQLLRAARALEGREGKGGGGVMGEEGEGEEEGVEMLLSRRDASRCVVQ
jgi:hypothetical protein